MICIHSGNNPGQSIQSISYESISPGKLFITCSYCFYFVIIYTCMIQILILILMLCQKAAKQFWKYLWYVCGLCVHIQLVTRILFFIFFR